MKGGLLFSSRVSSPAHSSHATPQRHIFSDTLMEENIEYAEIMITKWDVNAHTHSHNHNANFQSLFTDDRREAKRFLEAVAGLQSAMHYYVKLKPNSAKLVRAQTLMRIAIKRLEKEFYVTLSSNRKNLDSESVSTRSSRSSIRSGVCDFYEDEIASEEEDGVITPSRTPPRSPTRGGYSEADRALDSATADLKSIADCMIATGYGKECVKIYNLIRKSIVDETLYYLGVEKLNHSRMQKMEWHALDQKIKSWLHAVRVAVKTLFHGERILCNIVFSSSEKIAESCFAEISKDAALKLFNFPENFGKSKKIHSPEKIFRALDLYEAISDLWPEIESVFNYESLSAVRTEAVEALLKLGEAVRTMLSQFEAAIQKDSSKPTADGGVHPLTRYVMNFLIFLGDYSGPISDIVSDWQAAAQTPLPEAYFTSPTAGGGVNPSTAAITERLAWLILVLLCKLDGKAVLYNDVALSYLFLANNLSYVISKVRSSSLGLLMGPEWILTNRRKVNRYLSNYERMGWSNVTSALPEDPTEEITPSEAKECFRRFYLGFEEAYKKQGSWIIPDPQLRDNVKRSLAKKLVPGYRVFYEKHRAKYTMEIGVGCVVRYAPEDLDNYLSDLFFPSGAGTSTTSMSSRGR